MDGVSLISADCGKRVVVAMSGGVDSSVVAAMLKKDGYDVIGVTLQLFDYGNSETAKNQKTCCASKDTYDASKVAELFDFPHYVLNYESLFKEEVIDEFVDSYTKGYTPIPCIKCNQTVKFRDLYAIAKKLDANFLATGHYVRKGAGVVGPELLTGVDPVKDQSYFLFQTTLEQLDFLEFPLGEHPKEHTRQLAKDLGLAVHSKPDSQNICFVPDGNYAKIVEKYRPESIQDGEIIHMGTREVLGVHKGIINFTVGQRKRIGLSGPIPLYVIEIDADSNTIYVGPENYLNKDTFRINRTNWLVTSGEKGEIESLARDKDLLSVKVRASQFPIPCYIDFSSDTIYLKEETKLLCKGQAAVLYMGDRVIGGGFIDGIKKPPVEWL